MKNKFSVMAALLLAVSLFVLQSKVAEAADNQRAASETVVPTPERHVGFTSSKVLVELGLGVNNYNGAIADNLTPGGQWDVRLSARNNKMFGFEGAFSWGVNDLEGTDPQNGNRLGGTAITTDGDALARWNVLKEGRVRPFAVAGLGIINLSIRDQQSSSQDGTTVAIPFGAGVQYLLNERWTVGGRLNYRAITDILNNDLPSGDNWDAGLNVGARLF